mmetsp:Transcript_9841/g.20347  ORF Transcript_9841/g.20347 Transcript_9841/m.20347 type:complete len:467 (-) Transcript_9841:62-1462(-)
MTKCVSLWSLFRPLAIFLGATAVVVVAQPQCALRSSRDGQLYVGEEINDVLASENTVYDPMANQLICGGDSGTSPCGMLNGAVSNAIIQNCSSVICNSTTGDNYVCDSAVIIEADEVACASRLSCRFAKLQQIQSVTCSNVEACRSADITQSQHVNCARSRACIVNSITELPNGANVVCSDTACGEPAVLDCFACEGVMIQKAEQVSGRDIVVNCGGGDGGGTGCISSIEVGVTVREMVIDIGDGEVICADREPHLNGFARWGCMELDIHARCLTCETVASCGGRCLFEYGNYSTPCNSEESRIFDGDGSCTPSQMPSVSTTPTQSVHPSTSPTRSLSPTTSPSQPPTRSRAPTSSPSWLPSNVPSVEPSRSSRPSIPPSSRPSVSQKPSATQSREPSSTPSNEPTLEPTDSTTSSAPSLPEPITTSPTLQSPSSPTSAGPVTYHLISSLSLGTCLVALCWALLAF